MTHRWGFIGVGRVASTMARAFRTAEGNELAAVAGRTSGRVAEFVSTAGGGVRAYGTVDELVADPQLDVIYVSTPNALHREHIVAALSAGKHVLCEKPLAASADEAIAIRAEASRFPGRLGVAFQYRQHPAHQALRALLHDSELGDVRLGDVAGCLPALDVPEWYSRPGSGGGILPMSGVHRLDLMRFLLADDVVEVSAELAHFRDKAYDDAMVVRARYSQGTLVTMRFGLDLPFGDDRIVLHGTSGSAEVNGTMSQWWSTVPGVIHKTDASGRESQSFAGLDLYSLQIEAFGRFVDGKGTFATADDGVEAARTSEALYASCVSGQPVLLEHLTR